MGDRLWHELRVAERGQADPVDAVPEVGHEVGGDLDCKAGLARAARPRERDQSRPVEQHRAQVVLLPGATDECGHRARQVRVRDGLERREAVGAELEDPDRLLEVLQAMLAEILEPVGGEVACRLGQDDLATMGGGGDACSQTASDPA